MNAKYLFLIGILFLIALTAVSAQDNSTIDTDETGLKSVDVDENTISASDGDKLETTRYYDADTEKVYVDDKVVTHDVVKYYGDKDTKFNVKVQDSNHHPSKGVSVNFGVISDEYAKKTTDAKGMAYFPINYGVGTHNVMTYVDAKDGQGYWFAYNKVKVKTTIPTKTLSKYDMQTHKKFSIKFLNTKGKALKHKTVKIKVKGKTYKIKTNSKGIAKIKINSFKPGKHKITAYNPISKETRKILVKIIKKIRGKTVTLRLKVDNGYTVKKLKTGDVLLASTDSFDRQHAQGVSIGTMIDAGQEGQHSTRLIQAKIWFKNDYTGKIITKVKGTANKGFNIKHVYWIDDYTPYKAKVWYTHR